MKKHTNSELKQIYQEVLCEYNQSNLATDFGYHQDYSHYVFKEICICYDLINENSKILDIGTGSGILPRFFKKLGHDVWSIDSSKVSGSSALNNIAKAGITPIDLDISTDSIPLDDHSIDLIFMGDVIEHLIHSPKKILIEFHRILSHSGKLVIATPNSVRLSVRLRVFAGFSNWQKITDYFESYYNYGHHHEYTSSELRYILNGTNFSIYREDFFEENLLSVKLKSFKNLQPGIKNKGENNLKEGFMIGMVKKILYICTQIFPSLRGAIIIVGEKHG